jgi:hypothetical protein
MITTKRFINFSLDNEFDVRRDSTGIQQLNIREMID